MSDQNERLDRSQMKQKLMLEGLDLIMDSLKLISEAAPPQVKKELNDLLQHIELLKVLELSINGKIDDLLRGLELSASIRRNLESEEAPEVNHEEG